MFVLSPQFLRAKFLNHHKIQCAESFSSVGSSFDVMSSGLMLGHRDVLLPSKSFVFPHFCIMHSAWGLKLRYFSFPLCKVAFQSHRWETKLCSLHSVSLATFMRNQRLCFWFSFWSLLCPTTVCLTSGPHSTVLLLWLTVYLQTACLLQLHCCGYSSYPWPCKFQNTLI